MVREIWKFNLVVFSHRELKFRLGLHVKSEEPSICKCGVKAARLIDELYDIVGSLLGVFISAVFYIREFTQPRRQRQQERHKFAYLTVKNNRFARFARAFFIFGHSADVLVLSTT